MLRSDLISWLPADRFRCCSRRLRRAVAVPHKSGHGPGIGDRNCMSPARLCCRNWGGAVKVHSDRSTPVYAVVVGDVSDSAQRLTQEQRTLKACICPSAAVGHQQILTQRADPSPAVHAHSQRKWRRWPAAWPCPLRVDGDGDQSAFGQRGKGAGGRRKRIGNLWAELPGARPAPPIGQGGKSARIGGRAASPGASSRTW